MALQVFESARAKIEASRGAGGTPVRILTPSDITHTQTIQTIRPESFRGTYFGYFDAAAGTEQNMVSMSGNLDYSIAAWLGQVYVKGSVAASLGTSASGTAYTYAFTPSGTADDIASLAMELGYNDTASSTAIVSLKYLLGNELTLRWNKADSTVTYDAGLMSASTATKLTAFTGTPTTPTTALVSTSTTQVFLDATTIGSTSDANILTVEWSLANGVSPLYTLNNSTAAQAVYRPNHRTWTLKLTRYFATSGEWDVYSSKAERKIRVKSTGAALGTAGSYTVQLDCYGVLTGREVADSDGLGIETLTYEPYYDTGVSSDFVYTVIAADSAIS